MRPHDNQDRLPRTTPFTATARRQPVSPDEQRARFDAATAELEPPFAVLDGDALEVNADALAARAAGKPIRVASKSVRSREVLRQVLNRPGWRGIMAYTLPEAIWLCHTEVSDDLLIGYPTANRHALAELAASERLAACITLMIDSVDQLDFIDSVAPPGQRAPIRVCLDLDASWRPVGGAHIGVRRSPLHSATDVGVLARTVAGRIGFTLVGLMSYEAQIAGLGDMPPGRPIYAAALRIVQRLSLADLLARRGAATAAAREHADLEFVNGGGTGSVAATAADPAVTELTAGSGLFGPTLFDTYRAWRPQPAAFFATAVVRRPGPGMATVHGGGWIASGPAEVSRLPRPALPAGLNLLRAEGAGEVQTPVIGPVADTLRVGDRVWFRHAKAGELCEHVDALHVIRGDQIEREVLTYRGEHTPAFL